jgi:hypothetical protein
MTNKRQYSEPFEGKRDKVKPRMLYEDVIERRPVVFTDDGYTIQEQKDDCDINNIIEKFARTGLINHVNKHEPQFGEFANFDFQQQQTLIAKATQIFMQLPPKIRQQFNNSPANYIEFVKKQENIDDMKDGVIDGKAPETPDDGKEEKEEKSE